MNNIRKIVLASLSVAALSMSDAHASQQTIRLSGWTAGGFGCQTTVTRTPVIAYTVNNIEFNIGGPTGTPIPSRWEIDSPAIDMANTVIGVVVNTATHVWGETNTAVHNGNFVVGDWTVEFWLPAGAICADYNNRARVIFDLTP